MRGTFVDQGGLFSYIAPEARAGEPSAEKDPGTRTRCAGRADT